jgi:CBS domain-containing protein
MKTASRHETELILRAQTAADLMTPNPVSISAEAPVKEAVALFVDKGFSAAPVIDRAGRPVGVVSQADIVIHDRAKVDYLPARSTYERELSAPSGEPLAQGFQVESVERTRVADIMTPAVFSVAPDTPAGKVIEEMLSLKVHRLFVVGDDGVLVGVVSTSDVVRHLWPNE